MRLSTNSTAAPGAADGEHFDPNGNAPSTFTNELRKGVSPTLPFEMPDAWPPHSAGD